MERPRLRNNPELLKYSGSHKSFNIKIYKMKRNLLYFLIAATVFVGCTKEDGSVPANVTLEEVPQPQIVRNGGSVAIDLTNLASFQAKFDVVGTYFSAATATPPVKFDLVVRKNKVNTNIKLIKADISTFPTSFTVTAAQLVTLFGAPILLGDSYDFSLDVYAQSGKKYEAFPAVGVGFGSGVAGQPGASTVVSYTAICAYDPLLFAPIGGTADFNVITDEWGDDPVNGWGPPAGYKPTVKITVVDATHLSFKSPVNGTSIIVLTVNPLTNAITYTSQPYGDLKVGPLQIDPTYTYGPATVSNLGPNTVAPCDLQINLAMAYDVSVGRFRFDASRGFYLVLKKK